MLPDSSERSDKPSTTKRSRKETRRFVRCALSLRDNLRRRRQQQAARAVAQKERHTQKDI